MTITTDEQETVSRARARQAAPARFPISRFFRLATALLFAAAGVLAVLNEHAFRIVETQLAEQLLPFVLGGDVIAATTQGEPSIAFEGAEHWYALRITIECSIALYLGPLLVLGGALFALPKMNFFRVLIATSVSFAAMALLNQVRFAMLTSALSHGGLDTFEWVHSLVGSTMMLIGIAACLMLFFRLVVVGSRRSHRLVEEGAL